jgi:hypothetical protein
MDIPVRGRISPIRADLRIRFEYAAEINVRISFHRVCFASSVSMSDTILSHLHAHFSPSISLLPGGVTPLLLPLK